jgi:hypothetical protein
MRLRTWIEPRALAVAAALLLLASSAAAFPVVFDGASGFGVSAATATSVSGAGFPVIEGATVYPANDFSLVIPAPDVLSHHIESQPSVSNPTTAQSRWSVTNGGETNLDDAWLVFFTPLTYTKNKVGIDLQAGGSWALVDVSVGKTDYFYPAVFLGDVDADATVTFLMNHIVGQALTQQGPTTFVLPQYSVGLLQGVPLPEASTIVFLAMGLALVAALRRRKV